MGDEGLYIASIENIPELYLHAMIRGLELNPDPKVLCELIQEEIPSKEWQLSNLRAIADRELISEEELAMVVSYGSYGYRRMNDALRGNARAKALINDIIFKMPPLDRDIVVFRYLNDHTFLPKIVGQSFISKGYLSTTMDPLLAAGTACIKVGQRGLEKGALMKIRIPKGSKAIYLPGHERELLLAHNTNMILLKYSQGKFVCPSENKKSSYITDIPVYDFGLV